MEAGLAFLSLAWGDLQKVHWHNPEEASSGPSDCHFLMCGCGQSIRLASWQQRSLAIDQDLEGWRHASLWYPRWLGVVVVTYWPTMEACEMKSTQDSRLVEG